MRGRENMNPFRRVPGIGLGLVAVALVVGCEGATLLEGEREEATTVGPIAVATIERTRAGTVGDLVVDAERGLVYLSLLERNEIEILDYLGPPSDALVGAILVGSQPAGMTLDQTGDTLIVANSGGTSLSFVDLEERVERSRMETPNAILYSIDEILEEDDTTGTFVGEAEAVLSWVDFPDRPADVTQDRDGVIFYSTVGGGPIRMVETYPSYDMREANVMLWSDVLVADSGSWAVTYVDSIIVRPENAVYGGSMIVAYDHVPGQPETSIQASGGPGDFPQMFASLRAQGSDVFVGEDLSWDIGFWNVGGGGESAEATGTLFETSGDRSVVLFGDGDRLWTWRAVGPHPGYANRVISSYLSMTDFTSTSGIGGLTGLGADAGGSDFAARGGGTVVYFDELLRVHGSHTLPRLGGGQGLARHPALPVVFAATADQSILVLEAADHYQVLAEIPLDDNLVGPLQLTMPRADDPAELLVRLHGLTATGDVVTVSVSDRVLPFAP